MASVAPTEQETTDGPSTGEAAVFETCLDALRSGNPPANSPVSVERAKELYAALGSWLEDNDVLGGCRTVRRGSITTKERSGSLAAVAPLAPEEEGSAISVVPPEIPRSKLGFAQRHTEGHGLEMRPLLKSVRIPDVPILRDVLFALFPRLFKVLNGLKNLSMAVFLPLMPFLLAFAPLATMRCTGTARLLLNATDSAAPLPWGEAWDDASEALTMLWAAALTYANLYQVMMYTHPVALRLLWLKSKMRLLTVLGSALAYAVADATLLPDPRHVLWLVARTAHVLLLCLADSIFITYKLRFTPENYAKMFGGGGGKGYGVLGTLMLLGFVGSFLTDVFRHLLVQYQSDVITVVEFGVTNPFNGNAFGFTNHQAADGCFLTNLIFTGAVIFTVMKTHFGAETTLLATRFAIV